jgi:hypothetical protein
MSYRILALVAVGGAFTFYVACALHLLLYGAVTG